MSHQPTPEQTKAPRISSGNKEADEILGGGFPENTLNVIMGMPGTGKTLFAEQLIFHNASAERPILYLTTLSEPMSKIVRYLQQFPFFQEDKLGTEVIYEDIGDLLAAGGTSALLPHIKDAITTTGPKIIVIDSFKAIHDLATSLQEMRRMLYQLSGLLAAFEVTTFLIGEYSEDQVSTHPEFAVADAIIQFSRKELGNRDERFLRVRKLRGSGYREGLHAFRITDQGLEIFPRLVSPEIPKSYQRSAERVQTGVSGLDRMLEGGLWRGSNTLLAGPSGSGKTTVCLQFILEGVRQGEPGLYVNFQENPTQLAHSYKNVGFATAAERSGLNLMYRSPVELQVDSILVEIFRIVKEKGIKRLVIDAVGDLDTATDDRQRMHDYLYALGQHLAVLEVSTIFVLETYESGPGALIVHDRVSYLADNVILLGMRGEDEMLRRVRILKTRGSAHDHHARDLKITPDGVHVS